MISNSPEITYRCFNKTRATSLNSFLYLKSETVKTIQSKSIAGITVNDGKVRKHQYVAST